MSIFARNASRFSSPGGRRPLWAGLGALVLALVASLVLVSGGVFAGAPASVPANTPAQAQEKAPVLNDGFDALPAGLRAISYSTLFHMGKVHPAQPDKGSSNPAAGWRNNPF